MSSKDGKPAAPTAASAKDGPKKGKDAKKPAPEPMTEEDIKKKGEIDLLAERLLDPAPGVQKLALETLRHEIRTATSSMTSIPKPLKFLRPHYAKLKESFEKVSDADNKRAFADLLAVVGMTNFALGNRDCLRYKLQGNATDIAPWGHEFVRALSAEVSQEFPERVAAKKPIDDLLALVTEIIPFDVTHHAEPDACDLLMEVEQLPKIIDFADKTNYHRVCLYLVSCANYVPEPEDSEILKVVVKIYLKLKDAAAALRIALRLGDLPLIKEIFAGVTDAERKQLAFMLARHNISFEVADAEAGEIVSNVKLHEYYQMLGRELEVLEAKTPDDIYKQHLVESRAAVAVDSARQNLASTFVNAFVNAGFQSDKLMLDESNKWLYKNKEHGMMSAAASLGMILMWDVEGGISKVDKFLYSREEYVKAGALLAIGMLSTGVRNELEPAMGLLSEHVVSQTEVMRTGAILGLGLAYAGTAREDLVALLTPLIEDGRINIELAAYAALALGLIFVGTAHTGITGSIVQVFFERDDASLASPFARFFSLGLGLLYLGRQQIAEVTLETLRALEEKPIAKYTSLTVETCAYAGSGNVLKVQQMLAVCGEHPEKETPHQAVAVLGIAIVAMGEELGTEMAHRSFEHLMQYGEPAVRRAVPLAIGLLSLSNPQVNVTDALSKMSHDPDEDVAASAVLALGLIGAGTNNARIAGLLRQLSAYYAKNQQLLFVVRIGQGLLHFGKGLVTLSPWHSERLLLKPAALGGLLAVLHSCLDMKNLILGKAHYLLYMLAPAVTPRCLMAFDEKLQPIKTPVRVGQAVDTVGQAGKPKTITGFQTLNTPVLLGHGERAELATDEYLPLSPVLEGMVILRPNPNSTYKAEPKDKKKEATKEKLLEDVARFKPAPKTAPLTAAAK